MGRVLAHCQTGHAQWRSGFGPGLGSQGAGLAALSQVRGAARPLQPVLRLPATGGGDQNVNLLLVPSPFTNSQRHKEVRHPHALGKVQHAGSLGRARRVARRRRERRAARSAARSGTRFFSWSDAVPRSLIPNAPAHLRLHSSLRKLLQPSRLLGHCAERIHQSFAQRQPQARW
jgi:hypothetical protein